MRKWFRLFQNFGRSFSSVDYWLTLFLIAQLSRNHFSQLPWDFLWLTFSCQSHTRSLCSLMNEGCYYIILVVISSSCLCLYQFSSRPYTLLTGPRIRWLYGLQKSNITRYNAKAPVLGICEVWRALLLLLPGPIWSKVVVLVKVLCMDQIDIWIK